MGLSDEELEALPANDGDVGVPEDEEPLPEPPSQPITQAGDVWLIGRHRLISGDCRDFGVIEAPQRPGPGAYRQAGIRSGRWTCHSDIRCTCH